MNPTVEVLSPKELIEIDRASRELLQDVGVLLAHEEGLDLLAKAGAKVDRTAQTVRIPSHLVDLALSRCAPSLRLHGREGRRPLTIGGGRVHFGTVGIATNVLDRETGLYRPVLTEDMAQLVRLADVLEPPDFILVPATPTDYPSALVDVHEFKILLLNTTKHVIAEAQGQENLAKIVEMAVAVAGSLEEVVRKPFFSILVCLTSPLTIRQDAAELIVEGARLGLPLFIEAGPMSGGTSPATMAQTLIGANAELLASFVLAKLVNPAAPLVYASWARIIDMKSAGVSHGGPEFGLLRTATTQMAKFYGLPSGGGGILADSKLIDAQFGMEKLGTALFPALAGTNMISGMGLLADENAISPEALIIDHEIASWVGRAIAGIRVTAETTDISIFEEVGPGGDFIRAKHTRDNYRQEMWIPKIMDRGVLVQDVDPEPRSLRNRARKVLDKALADYIGPKLPEGMEARLEEIIGR